MRDLMYYEKEERKQNTFAVHFQHFKQKRSFRPHWHEYYELLFFRDGTATVHCNDNAITVKSGDLVVVNRNEVHTMHANSDCEYFCVMLFPELFSDIPLGNILIQNHIPNDKTIKVLMRNLYDERRSDRAGKAMMLKSHAYTLMTHLLRSYTVTHISEKESRLLAQKAQRLDKVLDYIDTHLAEKLSTYALAELCHLNESYFCRSFKKATGKSVLAYINDCRIEKAAELLEENDKESITAVAAAVGFDDISYFGRCFKKLKRVSPRQYKKQK